MIEKIDDKMYSVPILFLIFARPETTKQVFERIRQIQPTKLYVAADAPRNGHLDESNRSKETRRIIDRVDWPCEVHTLFRSENLGCKIAVSSAITWFFQQEEYGVILEDDCLPDLSFFPFCEELLIKYKEDDRIGHIGGNNFFSGIISENVSYDFCSFSHIWGWATWRRIWDNYDVNFSFWEDMQFDKRQRRSIFKSINEEIYFSSFISDAIKNKNRVNTWDTQYFFMLRTQNLLSILPSTNLVTNIGLNDPNATHTISKKNKESYILSKSIKFPLNHPKYIMSNREYDDCIIKRKFFSYKRLLRFLFKDY